MENPEVYVGRLPRTLSRQQLDAGLTYWFSFYDSIRSIIILESRFQIYAYVEYDHAISARAAIHFLHNKALFGSDFETSKVAPRNYPIKRRHPPCNDCALHPPNRSPPPPLDPVHNWWYRTWYQREDDGVYWNDYAQPGPAIRQQLGQQYYVNQRPIEQVPQLPPQLGHYQLQAYGYPARVPQPPRHVQQLPQPHFPHQPQLPLQIPAPRYQQPNQLPHHFPYNQVPRAQQPRPQPKWEAPYEQHLTQEQIIAKTLTIFPDIDPSWVAMQAASRPLGELSMYIVENMDTVPKAPKPQKRKAGEAERGPEAKIANVDYLAAPLRWKYSEEYGKVVEQRFAYDFPQISLPSLRNVLEAFGYNYAPAYAALHEELSEPVWTERDAQPRQKAVKWNTTRPLRPADALFTAPVTSLLLLAIKRRFRQEPPIDARLRDEVVWIQRHFAKDQVVPVQDAPKDAAALEECGICVEELEPTTFEECENGHRFCSNCIRTQARETALGLGGGKVVCLEHGCGVEYSRGVLARVLDETLLRQVDEAAGEQALAAAGLDNLVRCKRCNWGAIIDEPPQIAQIFLCRNDHCCRSWCRLCDREYDKDHIGKMCAEVETDAETANRKRLEEALTAAVVRRCHRCALPFQKTQGCNKMTCTCGATSCYLCRVPDVNYDHFCGHLRIDPNRCTVCAKRCALFEDSDRVDQFRLEQVQNYVA